ncbi:cullin-5 [Strongylocentrotus purpuratus]|uniref:Cullin-5 n=1 Tax=Strongylocentrotus purpuratus TaxID=7668 RepID=A0A7M7T3G8_STRPU|nr:cullin-5-like isoform X1 [Strongylocentrotus purpuratus]XP_030851131.1 cullin-5 [Strongylocentrotus purpuratus]
MATVGSKPSGVGGGSSMLKQDKTQPQFEDRWEGMRPTVLKLLRQENVSRNEWHDLFWEVYSVCVWDDKGVDKVNEALKHDIVEFVQQAKQRVLHDQDESALLKAYIREWGKYFTQCDYLPKPFKPLETATGKGSGAQQKKANQQNEDSTVRKLMLESWSHYIFSKIKQKLQESAMGLVLAERNGEAFEKQLVIGVRESYVNLCLNSEDRLQIYKENFEKAYLDATEAFYKAQAPNYLAENGVQNYMRYADSKLKEEEMRASRYLDTSKGSNSMSLLTECCVECLVSVFKEEILRECAPMIKNNETDKLNLMLKLMDRVPEGINPMLRDLEQHIIEAGLADMVAAAEIITTDSEKYVERLLELFHRFSNLVKEAFNDDPRFLTSRDKAYRHVVNDTKVFRLELPTKNKSAVSKGQPESRCPELLANYCDMLLRKTPLSKRLTSEEIESKLRNVLLVLKYVQNKDVFMRYHKAHLTRRLILDTSADSEKEENMVEWLREVGMPADYVNKLARMFQDIKVSEDLNQSFKELHRNNYGNVADNMNIKILNAGAWSRSSERVPCSLPVELEDFIPEVEEFYRNKHNGRKLQWHHLMSNGIITMKNEVGMFDLEVTTFQMAVLYAWNQRPLDKISLENLRLATELPDHELRRTLWSLVAFAKLKRQMVLMQPEAKSPKEFVDGTVFWVNQDFAVIKNGKPQKRGKINLIGRLQLSTERSTEEDKEGIVQLRILRTQEAIVKIMKMRKKLNNAQLQTELVEILKNMFLPQKKMIKEQIEWLIEHKYMKRDEGDINTFIYLA